MHYCGDNISPVSNKRMLSTSVRSTLDSEQCRTTFVESFELGSTFFVLSAGVHPTFLLRFLIALFRPPIATCLLTMEGFCCHSRWISSSVHHGECFQPVHLELNSSFSSLEPHLCFFFAGSFLFFWQHEHLYDFLHETEWITKHNIHR